MHNAAEMLRRWTPARGTIVTRVMHMLRFALLFLVGVGLVALLNSSPFSTALSVQQANAAGPAYSTGFANTENPISEGGNWLNGRSNGLTWTDVRTTPGKAIGTQSGSSPTQFDDSTAILTGQWGADQSAQATIFVTSTPSPYSEVELRLRSTMTAGSSTGYEFTCSVHSGGSYVGIAAWEGPLGSYRTVAFTNGIGCQNGDVISASAIGSTLTFSKNGVVLFNVTDTEFASGAPGIGFFLQSGDSSLINNYGFTNFSASSNGAASPPPPATATRGATPTSTSAATATPQAPTPTSPPSSFPASPSSCNPCSIWSAAAAPSQAATDDLRALEVGLKFASDVSGSVTGIRFYKASTNTGTHIGSLWTTSGQQLASASFTNESASGWQQVLFSSPVPITANTTYVASYHMDNGGYSFDRSAFVNNVDSPPLHALADSLAGGNGVYAFSDTPMFPASSYQSSNFWVDVIFSPESAAAPVPAGSSQPPSGPSATASGSSQSLPPSPAVSQSPSPIASPSATPSPTATRSPSPSPTASPTPSPQSVQPPVLFANCPCSIWPNSATPAQASIVDPRGLEVGLKFKSDVSGLITGIRFYKGSGNTGTHVGSLWTSNGQRLASGTFSEESATGWQKVLFSSPVPITANTTYVASYHMVSGGYSVDRSAFVNNVDSPPLHALADSLAGGNGVYVFSDTSTFPTSSYQSSNFWVDVIFTS